MKIMQKSSYFMNTISQEEQDMMQYTRNLTLRGRLDKEEPLEDLDLRKKLMTQEYGNYDKYAKNKVK